MNTGLSGEIKERHYRARGCTEETMIGDIDFLYMMKKSIDWWIADALWTVKRDIPWSFRRVKDACGLSDYTARKYVRVAKVFTPRMRDIPVPFYHYMTAASLKIRGSAYNALVAACRKEITHDKLAKFLLHRKWPDDPRIPMV